MTGSFPTTPDDSHAELTPDDESAGPLPRRTTVLLAVLLTIALGGGGLALLLYRALAMAEPDAVFVVRANRDWQGAELIVEGGSLPQPRRTQIERLGNYTVPFFLWPGQYTLRVRSQGVEVWTEHFALRRRDRIEFDLTRSGATTLPATLPATTQSAPP
jgi:hypothetical protein